MAWAALAMLNASAQDTGTAVVAQVQSLDRLEAEQARLRKLMEGKPPAYEDKVMDPSTVNRPGF